MNDLITVAASMTAFAVAAAVYLVIARLGCDSVEPAIGRNSLPEVDINIGCSKEVYEHRQMLGWINELTKPAKAKKQLPRNKRLHSIKSLTNKGKLCRRLR